MKVKPTVGCGSCSLCCFLMAVPDIDKPSCLWCEHTERPHGGCRIYDQPEKPEACTAFKCLWLASQSRKLDDRMPYGLRPDRCMVMFHDALATLPADHEVPEKDRNVMYVHVHPDHPGAWLNPEVQAQIGLVLSRGCKVKVHIGQRTLTLGPNGRPLEAGAVA